MALMLPSQAPSGAAGVAYQHLPAHLGPGATTAPGSGGTYYAPPPGSMGAAEDYTGAQQAYNNALARYNQQRQGLLTQYGYKGTVDPSTGMMTNIGVDTGNATGQLQQLLHSQFNDDQAAEFNAEDRGLSGGLAHQAEGNLRYGHQADDANLANTLQGNLEGIDANQLDSKTTLDQALWQLQQQATNTATDAGNFNPADLSSLLASAGLGGSGTKGKTAAASVGQSAPGGIVTDKSGGYYDPSTGQYYTKGTGPASLPAPKAKATQTPAQKKAAAAAAVIRSKRTG